MAYIDVNSKNRQKWLMEVISKLPNGNKILDAGAGRLRNKDLCAHLIYESQDFCQVCEYDVLGAGRDDFKNHTDSILASKIDYVCDIVDMPQSDNSYDAILCSEVLVHIPDPVLAIKEFSRLLKPGGVLILTAPFASLVHLAPYHYSTGFSRYWYEHHLPLYGFDIKELSPNGDWFTYFYQELMRLGSMSRQNGDRAWPLAYILSLIGALYFRIKGGQEASDVACFGWHCLAIKS